MYVKGGGRVGSGEVSQVQVGVDIGKNIQCQYNKGNLSKIVGN